MFDECYLKNCHECYLKSLRHNHGHLKAYRLAEDIDVLAQVRKNYNDFVVYPLELSEHKGQLINFDQ